jgi:hypothetical protein
MRSSSEIAASSVWSRSALQITRISRKDEL